MDNVNLKTNSISFSGLNFMKKPDKTPEKSPEIQDGNKKSMDVLTSYASVMGASVVKLQTQETYKTPKDVMFDGKTAYDKETGKLFTGSLKREGGYVDSTIVSKYLEGRLQTSIGKMNDGRVFYSFETKKDGTKVEKTFFVTKEKGMEDDGDLLSEKIIQPNGSYQETQWLPGMEWPTETKTVDVKEGLIITESRLMGKSIIDKKKGTYSTFRKDGTLDRMMNIEDPKIAISMHKDGVTVKSISQPNGDSQWFDENGILEHEFKGEDYIAYNKEGKITYRCKRSELEQKAKLIS